jgi:hypothetical protein
MELTNNMDDGVLVVWGSGQFCDFKRVCGLGKQLVLHCEKFYN